MSNSQLSLHSSNSDQANKKLSIIINRDKFIQSLNKMANDENIDLIRTHISNLINDISSFRDDQLGLLNIVSNGDTIRINKQYLISELIQIKDSKTLERAVYYINRLLRGLEEVKTSKINDINILRWKEYDEVITDSLWVISKRDNSGAHIAEYWGNFIPQIPHLFLRR